jgi:hypothetical protein
MFSTAMTENMTETNQEKPESVVDHLFDLAEAWAAYGLKVSKVTLKRAARALDKTARVLDTIAQRLEKKTQPGTPEEQPAA